MKKNPIIFIAMLIALAFTSCQMNTDDTGVNPVVPPAPTYKITVTATNGTASYPKTAKAGETITVTEINPESGYEFDLGKVTIKDANGNTLSVDATTKSFVMPASNVTITVEFVKITDGGNPTTPTTDGDEDNNNGGNGTGEAEETSVTIPNVNVYIETHENGLGLNDGKKHGSFKLSKEGNTVTITVVPETGYELGYVLTKDTYGNTRLMNENGEIIKPEEKNPIRIRATYNNNGSTEAHNLSITEVSNGVYTFEMLDNVIVNLKARFDPITGYTVKSNNLSIAKGKTESATSTENISVKPGTYFTVALPANKTNLKPLIIGGIDYSVYLGINPSDPSSVYFVMPAHDVAVTTTLKNQQ